MSSTKTQRWNPDDLWAVDFGRSDSAPGQTLSGQRLSPKAVDSKAVDDFLQLCHNKPFWLWGQPGHQTVRICPNCDREYPENVSQCKCTLLGYFKDYRNEDFPIHVDTVWKDPTLLTKKDCCFNHIIGLPVKRRKNFDTNDIHWETCPIFDWQKEWFFDPFESPNDLLYIKAGGISATETKLRHIAWRASCSYKYSHADVPVIVGPKKDLAVRLIDRFKDLFPFHIDTPLDRAKINDCNVWAFAADNIEALRSLTQPIEIVVDEFDFFRTGELPQVLAAIFRYVGKAGAVTRAISTPNEPGGFCETLKDTPGSFIVKMLHYSVALGTIYTIREIEEAKKREGFEREFCLVFLGGVGNFFDPYKVDQCICAPELYNPTIPYREAITYMGVDTGWSVTGNRNYFAIVIGSWVQFRVYIMYVNKWRNPDVKEMIDTVRDLRMQYYVDKILIDGSDPEFIYQMKKELKEFPWDYHEVDKALYKHMIVEPSTFTKEQFAFLEHDKQMIEDQAIVIHPTQKDLEIAFKSAYMEEKKFIKEKSSNNDVLDAASMMLKKFQDRRVGAIK